MSLKFITAEQAAELVNNGDIVSFSGFTPAGAAKAVPTAIAQRAVKLHEAGKEYKISVITGASTGPSLDGALAKADAINWRTPYQSNKDLRASMNSGNAKFFDMHLSHTSQFMNYGFFGKINVAVIEACDVTDDGVIIPTSSCGTIATGCKLADIIIVELNRKHPKTLRGIHDIYQPANPPHRTHIPIYTPSDRCGEDHIKVDPKKIAGIVETDLHDEVAPFTPSDPITDKIGANVADFLIAELRAGRIPKEFLPLQSGVGNIANAVLGALGENKEVPAFNMYTEVIQDSVIRLMREGRCKFASGCSLTVSPDCLDGIYADMDFFKPKLVLRPQEVSNSPEVARRLGIIAMNTAIEMDIFGHINSTQIMGTKMMNGVGGSGDFTRNSYLTIYTAPSVTKGGAISAVVPMCAHIDHTEHDTMVFITEQGVADLRGKNPTQRAHEIIEHCVHPDYKQMLWDYLKLGGTNGHTPHTLAKVFNMHLEFANSGDMRNTKF
ncbi:MAG: acetyl-CoA hydrolase/transferase family protein [Ignavibacteria bacterium]|jgi:succinate CoA transferase|nr:acetyl-CoA hydrolase/transferase family protein [Ignavibacteria bacterium]